MLDRDGKRLGCLLLMGFAVGCGTQEPTVTEESHPSAATQTAEDHFLKPSAFAQPGEARTPSISVMDSSEAQMPELLVPFPKATAIDAEVQPAAAVGLPTVESLPFPNNPNTASFSVFAELVEAYRAGQPEQWTRAETAIHAQGSATLPALFEGLNSPDQQTRELASMMLSQVVPNLLYAESQTQRPDALLLAGQLRRALQDDSAEVRANVAVALSLMEGEGPALVPILGELLASELPHVRTMAVSALGGLGSPAVVAIPAIEQLSRTDNDPTTKAAAMEALSQLRAIQ